MQRIDLTAVRGASTSGNTYKPHAVATVCPHCRAKVTFSLKIVNEHGPQNSVSFLGACPPCKKEVGFWSVNSGSGTAGSRPELFMHPSAKDYIPAPDELELLPIPLRRSLISTIETYNSGIYTGAAVLGRRTLEGIFKYLVQESKRNLVLATLIDAAIAEQDLAAPLKALSHAIRSGGNLGAHFDMEHEPNEAVARQMVELLTYLISYLYVLPVRIQNLETELNKTEAQ